MLNTTPGFSGKPRKCSTIFVMSSKLKSGMARGEQAMRKQQVSGTGFLGYCVQLLLSQLCALNHFSEGNYCYWRDNLSVIVTEKSRTMDDVLQGISKNCSAAGNCCYFVVRLFSLIKFLKPANLK